MSVMIYGPSCEPGGQPIPMLGIVTPEPTHDRCPGGQHTPGVIGGWDCRCDCHRSAPAVPVGVPERPCRLHDDVSTGEWCAEHGRRWPCYRTVGVQPEPAEERSACGDSVCTNLGCTDACGLAAPVVHPEPGSVTHQCPAEGFGTTGCCGRPPFELPPTDRLSVDEADVTCPGVVHPEPGDRAAMVSKEAEAAAVAAYFEFGRREGFEPFGYPLAAALEAAAPHIVAAAVAAVRADTEVSERQLAAVKQALDMEGDVHDRGDFDRGIQAACSRVRRAMDDPESFLSKPITDWQRRDGSRCYVYITSPDGYSWSNTIPTDTPVCITRPAPEVSE